MMNITVADGIAEYGVAERLRARSAEVDRMVTSAVSDIIYAVRMNGDAAVAEYTRRFDGEMPENIEVTRAETDRALAESRAEYLYALRRAADNIRDFHERQKRQSWLNAMPDGSMVGQRVRGLSSVGVYVPGGTAQYPSSVLMNVIPAKIAGVREIVMVTPPPKSEQANRNILAAAAVAGVDRIFLVGGAQAIAALAYGTQTIPAVDKIVGPGNIYVATAKRLLYGTVDIDMVAGPSEILVIADETADPRFVAADLLSQAEHDKLAGAVLLTTSAVLAKRVCEELERQTAHLSRREIIETSLRDCGAIIVTKSVGDAIDFANLLAPEHLELCVRNPMDYLGSVDNAGAVFLGNYSPEALGDYFAGPNHVLPTGGTARFFSPLSVDDFVKKSSFIYYTENALFDAKDKILELARVEGLDAHANSVRIRF